MKTKRTSLNEYIIKQFLNDEIAGYNASFNGEWYFSLKNMPLYGGKVLKLRNDMGYTIIHIDNDNVTECADRIQTTLVNLDKIIKQEKSINDYCTKNPWTYSGT